MADIKLKSASTGTAQTYTGVSKITVPTTTEGQTVTFFEDGGTEVVANPTAAGTEDLTKLQVGSNVYNIPTGDRVGGTKLYAHNVFVHNWNDGAYNQFCFVGQFINKSSTAITLAELRNLIQDSSTFISQKVIIYGGMIENDSPLKSALGYYAIVWTGSEYVLKGYYYENGAFVETSGTDNMDILEDNVVEITL